MQLPEIAPSLAPWEAGPLARSEKRQHRAPLLQGTNEGGDEPAEAGSYEPPAPAPRELRSTRSSGAGVTLEAFEIQRYSPIHRKYAAQHLLPMDPKPFTTRSGAAGGWASLDEVPCPAGLQFLEGLEWKLNPRCLRRGSLDADGWFYADAFRSVAQILAEGQAMQPAPSQRLNVRVRQWLRRVGCADTRLSDPRHAELPPRVFGRPLRQGQAS